MVLSDYFNYLGVELQALFQNFTNHEMYFKKAISLNV